MCPPGGDAPLRVGSLLMQIRRASLPADRDAIDLVIAQVERADLHPPLSEEALVALDSAVSPVGWLAEEAGAVSGFAQRRERGGATVVEVAILPERRAATAALLVDRICADEAAARLRFWAADSRTVDAVEAAGAISARYLLRLEGPLPPAERPTRVGRVRIVPFRPGADEGAYLIVSNDAFAGHPESGAWDRSVFAERTGRSWFDPDGLFLAWERGRPAGACWTKVHAGGVGEIYSIAVRPSEAGRGLGRSLLLTGFWYLTERRGSTVGMVWVDRANEAAVRLYRRMGLEPVTGRTELLMAGR